MSFSWLNSRSGSGFCGFLESYRNGVPGEVEVQYFTPREKQQVRSATNDRNPDGTWEQKEDDLYEYLIVGCQKFDGNL